MFYSSDRAINPTSAPIGARQILQNYRWIPDWGIDVGPSVLDSYEFQRKTIGWHRKFIGLRRWGSDIDSSTRYPIELYRIVGYCQVPVGSNIGSVDLGNDYKPYLNIYAIFKSTLTCIWLAWFHTVH